MRTLCSPSRSSITSRSVTTSLCPRLLTTWRGSGARAIVEFVPKLDPDGPEMLSARDDVFGSYTIDRSSERSPNVQDPDRVELVRLRPRAVSDDRPMTADRPRTFLVGVAWPSLAALFLYPLAAALDGNIYYLQWQPSHSAEAMVALIGLAAGFALVVHRLGRLSGATPRLRGSPLLAAAGVFGAGVARQLPLREALIPLWERRAISLSVPTAAVAVAMVALLAWPRGRSTRALEDASHPVAGFARGRPDYRRVRAYPWPATDNRTTPSTTADRQSLVDRRAGLGAGVSL